MVPNILNSEKAGDFLSLMLVESGRTAFLGDASKFSTNSLNAITAAKREISVNVQKVTGLVKDPTRTEVQKHAAAKQLAVKTIAQLQKSKEIIQTQSAELKDRASLMADQEFSPTLERSSLDSEIRGWIREQAVRPDGISKIREAMEGDKNIATTIYHSPRFLLGLSENVKNEFNAEILMKHAPEAAQMLGESMMLNELVSKYDKVANSVNVSFYNPVMAEKANLRVDV